MAKTLNTPQLASRLGLTVEEVISLNELGEIRLINGHISSKDATRAKQRIRTLLKVLNGFEPIVEVPQQKRRVVVKKPALKLNAKTSIPAPTKPVVQAARKAPLSATLHMGPTNSGKTYEALQALAASGAGVYASPLRMLAFEAYEKLKKQLGEDKVGLITGEENINSKAPILCVTPEVAPLKGKVLVVDEAQWVKDDERGWAWTALLRSEYEHIHICGTREVEDLAKQFFADAEVLNVKQHQRLTGIKDGGIIKLTDVPPRSVVVAFSKKKVLALARDLIRDGVRPAVLYGSLPPQVRRQELEYFNSGGTDIMVATDVVGHGVNMPVDNVVFAEARKFDGTLDRELEVWELAQIAGRAGRFGLSESGTIYGLEPMEGFSVDAEKVTIAAESAGGLIVPSGALNRAQIAPTFEELNVKDPLQMRAALNKWIDEAARIHVDSPVTPSKLLAFHERLDDLQKCMSEKKVNLSVDQVWSLIRLPLNRIPFKQLVRILHNPANTLIDRQRHDPEAALGVTQDLIKFTKIVKHRAPFSIAKLTDEAQMFIQRISLDLDDAVRFNTYGICFECNRSCSPNFSVCDKCHSR